MTGEGIRSTGGWIETFAFWRSDLHSHIGYGVDSPLSQDVADGVEEPFFGGTGRTYNSTIFANLFGMLVRHYVLGMKLRGARHTTRIHFCLTMMGFSLFTVSVHSEYILLIGQLSACLCG